MVPFFVVDRPISLKIIQGLVIPRGRKIGLMAHANTSSNFRQAFRAYPHRRVVKMCDSAIFNLGGYKSGYAELFELYEEMGTDYGVMIDVFRNSQATIDSARKALAAYNPQKYHFKLVAVAQGKTVKEYLDCYRQLEQMGFRYIAVGGLLEKRERTARYANVRSERLMTDVLMQIRQEFNPEWLFALGSLHPSRLELFNELDVWGDYKGWIFEYKKRDDSLKQIVLELSTNHLAHTTSKFEKSILGSSLKAALSRRQKRLREREKAHKRLLQSKRSLRDHIAKLSETARGKSRKLGKQLGSLKSRGLLEVARSGQLLIALRKSGISKEKCDKLITLAEDSRLQKTKLRIADRKLETSNHDLLLVLRRLRQNQLADSDLKKITARITHVLKSSEQSHRIRQVRNYVEKRILAEL